MNLMICDELNNLLSEHINRMCVTNGKWSNYCVEKNI